MFTAFLHMATLLLTPIRLFDEEAAETYVRFQNFMLPRFIVGAIRTEEDYIMALEAFTDTLLDED
ncbi:hypothetical protein SEA_DOXI13_27 [Streptomyces phage Doxi13]|nr:hypothetical protein SEA_DOXI13_27 [Streptomyces phage Doxi13]